MRKLTERLRFGTPEGHRGSTKARHLLTRPRREQRELRPDAPPPARPSPGETPEPRCGHQGPDNQAAHPMDLIRRKRHHVNRPERDFIRPPTFAEAVKHFRSGGNL